MSGHRQTKAFLKNLKQNQLVLSLSLSILNLEFEEYVKDILTTATLYLLNGYYLY